MKRKGRRAGDSNLSFLDVVSCGFGAIVLLLVIVKTTAPEIAEATALPVVEVAEQLAELQLQIEQQEAEVKLREGRLEAERQKLRLSREELEKKKQAAHQAEVASMTQNKIHGQLELAMQDIDEEMRRLTLKPSHKSAVGGIPADSRYIIFIVDTSGSMQRIWGRVERELVAVLNAYPKVVGIQILDDMGRYMFPGYKGRWIPDTPSRRKAIARHFKNWSTYSNSSPVEGIIEAMKTYGGKSDRISLYVFGDDFNGSVQNVVKQVKRLNQAGKNKTPRVRIHAVAFDSTEHISANFALLMKELSYRNNGTFIGLK